MNQVIQNIKTRTSTRNFTDKQVDREVLDQILDAGLYAPSGMNRQAVKCVAVTNKEVRDLLSRLNADVMGAKNDPFYGAPTVVVVFADSNCHTHIEDGSLVLGTMLLTAHSLGVGSCWIHRAKEMFETPEGEQLKAK